jgi:uncharacterized oligopeptide transporter (OPT) family protein
MEAIQILRKRLERIAESTMMSTTRSARKSAKGTTQRIEETREVNSMIKNKFARMFSFASDARHFLREMTWAVYYMVLIFLLTLLAAIIAKFLVQMTM